METFNFKLTTESSGEIDHKINEIAYGDGYVQATSAGINNKTATWSITAVGKAIYIRPIINFIDRHQGVKSFYWTPSEGKKGRYRTNKYKIQNVGSDVFRISATFTQCYGVDAKAPTGVNVLSVNGETPDEYGDVTLTAEDIGADTEGTATKAIAELRKEKNPFTQYALAEKVPDVDFINKKFKEIDANLTETDTDVINLQSGLSDTNEYLSEVHAELEGVSGELFELKDSVTANTTAITAINSTMIKSVNNVKPDAQGNVKIEIETKGVEIDDKESSDKTVYSSQKTVQVIDNKLTELANSDDENKGAGFIGFNVALAYLTNSVGGALNKLADQIDSSGVPLFTTSWWPSRTNIPAGYVAADGHELPYATYPEAAQAITDNKVPTVSDSVWLSNPSTRGCYVRVSREGYFRLPDYNGMQTDSLGALFVRGGNRGVADGVIQGDAIRNIVGDYGSILRSDGNATGPFEMKNSGTYVWQIGPSGTGGGGFSFDASRVVPTAEENRPINVTGCWIIKLFGALVNVGSADAAQLATDYANLMSRIIVLESIQQQKRFTIIYPNGGAETNPATILSNKRYIEDNPFPNNPVICKAEVLVNDTWGSVEWLFSNGGAGVTANHLTESDKIIVQTGSKAVVANSSASGGATGYYGNDLTTAPCRVKVWRIM